MPLVQFKSDSYRGVPNVDTFIKGAARQVLAVGAVGHAVDRFLVLGQRVNTNTSLDIPQSHRRVKRGTMGVEKTKTAQIRYESSNKDLSE